MANKRDSDAESPLAFKDIGRTLTVQQVRAQLDKLAKKADRLEDLAVEVRAKARWLALMLEVEEQWPNLAAKLEAERLAEVTGQTTDRSRHRATSKPPARKTPGPKGRK